MNDRPSRPRRPSPAMLVSLLALFIALGGTATALKGKNTVDSGDIKNGQVKTPDLARNSIKGKHVAPNAITGRNIVPGSITGQQIADGAVTTEKLKDGAITSAKIADGAVTTGKIAEDTPAASVTRTTDQTISPSGADIVFDQERYDTAGSWPTNNAACLRAPIAGIYDITAAVTWEADADGVRWLTLFKGSDSTGSVVAQAVDEAVSDSQATSQTVSANVPMVAGECVRLKVNHNATDLVDPDGPGGTPPIPTPKNLKVLSLTGANGSSPSLSLLWAAPGA